MAEGGLFLRETQENSFALSIVILSMKMLRVTWNTHLRNCSNNGGGMEKLEKGLYIDVKKIKYNKMLYA